MLDLIKIWNNQTPSKDDLIIKTKIETLNQFNCYLATNHILGNHYYFMDFSSDIINIPNFSNFKFKGVKIELFELSKQTKQLNIYLLDIELKEIFSLFINNIIKEISTVFTENEAITKTSNVIFKWKKLFDKISKEGLSIEQQKGLIGELLFIDLLSENGIDFKEILNCWSGPDFESKDFTFRNSNIEVKFTTSKLPRVKITSERQLESFNENLLFLFQYNSEITKKGYSLNSLIKDLKQKIKDKNIIKFFEEKLETVGYLEEDKLSYDTQYLTKSFDIYLVDKKFPKITSKNIPLGIYNTSYYIEKSAIIENITELENLVNSI